MPNNKDKLKLKDRIDGDELDLSLSSLSTVPVKELAPFKKITSVDLSCNQITFLPDDFTTLIHLVKIDLSKNGLISLPSEFGNLENLQHLDLFDNKLEELPVSFCDLRKLKWLDLRKNKFSYELEKAAGDCLSEKECQLCAKKVLVFMKSVKSELDKERMRLYKIEREREAEREALQRKLDEEEKLLRKEEKRIEKEKRRKEFLAAQAERQKSEGLSPGGDAQSAGKTVNGASVDVKQAEKKGLSCCGVFLAFLFGLVAILTGLYFYCQSTPSDLACKKSEEIVLKYYGQVKDHIQKLLR